MTITVTRTAARALVLFGVVSAPIIAVNSTTQVQAVTLPDATGVVNMTVQDFGNQFAKPYGGFTYTVLTKAHFPPLRDLADQRGFTIGAGATDPRQISDPRYAWIAKNQYNAIEPGNVMKMYVLEPFPGLYDFAKGDAVVAFAKANGQHVTATAPVWYAPGSNPPWLLNGGYTGDELQMILHDYITAIMQHYHNQFPGVVDHWAIVSEATHGTGIWDGIPGGYKAYVTLSYQYARAADPTVKLCYDDYGGEGLGVESDVIYDLVLTLKNQGLIDCVGLEGQWETSNISDIPSPTDITANINRLGALGLEVYFSQVEIGIPSSNGNVADNKSDLTAQAMEYEALLNACLSTSACKGFFSWGITDKYAFCNDAESCAPLSYNTTYHPKPSYFALRSVLAGGLRYSRH